MTTLTTFEYYDDMRVHAWLPLHDERQAFAPMEPGADGRAGVWAAALESSAGLSLTAAWREAGRPRSRVPMVATTVRLPLEEWQLLEAYAVNNDTNMGLVVRDAVRAYCIRKPAPETETNTGSEAA